MPNSQFRWICLVFLVIISRISFLLLLNLLTSSSKSSVVNCIQCIHKRCRKLCTTKIDIFFLNLDWKYWLPSQKYLQAVNSEGERELKFNFCLSTEDNSMGVYPVAVEGSERRICKALCSRVSSQTSGMQCDPPCTIKAYILFFKLLTKASACPLPCGRAAEITRILAPN